MGGGGHGRSGWVEVARWAVGECCVHVCPYVCVQEGDCAHQTPLALVRDGTGRRRQYPRSAASPRTPPPPPPPLPLQGWKETRTSGFLNAFPFDPAGMNSADMAVKEVKNGRLAMVAFVGFAVQVGGCPQGRGCGDGGGHSQVSPPVMEQSRGASWPAWRRTDWWCVLPKR